MRPRVGEHTAKAAVPDDRNACHGNASAYSSAPKDRAAPPALAAACRRPPSRAASPLWVGRFALEASAEPRGRFEAPTGYSGSVSTARTPRKILVIAITTVIGVGVVLIALFAFASSSSMPAQITYHGHTYGSMVAVTPIEVRAHIGTLSPTGETIAGKAAYVSSGTPPRIVALSTGHGGYDAYQLSS
jgi:hypothetical protein